MSSIILHQFQGIAVGLNQKDGYINATKLCIAYNLQTGATKKPDNWLRTQRAKDNISYLAAVSQKRETELIIIRQGGSSDEQGTWIHPKLAIPFATWLSVEFEYQVSEWIDNWSKNKDLNQFPQSMTGSLQLSPVESMVRDISVAVDVIFRYNFLAHAMINKKRNRLVFLTHAAWDSESSNRIAA